MPATASAGRMLVRRLAINWESISDAKIVIGFPVVYCGFISEGERKSVLVFFPLNFTNKEHCSESYSVRLVQMFKRSNANFK